MTTRNRAERRRQAKVNAGQIELVGPGPGLLHSAFTFSRASAQNDYGFFNGVLTPFAPNVPRWVDAPGGGYGLSMEQQRTNLALYSEDFTQAAWVKINMMAFGSGSVADAIAAPDGLVTADLLVENTATGLHQIYQTITVTPTQNFASRYFLKPAGRSRVEFYILSGSDFYSAQFNLTGSGSVVVALLTSGTAIGLAATITPRANGWYECVIVGQPTTAANTQLNTNIRLHNGTAVTYTGDGVSGMYFWGGGVEVGSAPTSYIKTTNAPITRAVDRAFCPLSSLGLPGTGIGTYVAEFVLVGQQNGYQFVAQIDDGTDSNRLIVGIAPNGNYLSIGRALAGAFVATGGGAVTYGARTKIAFSLSGDGSIRCSLAGAAPVSISGGPTSGLTHLRVGNDFGLFAAFNGQFGSFSSRPYSVSDSVLQTLSA
jgi:hypothetical protein